jgi:hypothetical protein
MIIIAFSEKTSKILPRILCRKIKHTAPIAVYHDKLIMHQFITHRVTEKIELNMRDLQLLRRHGWKFIYLTGKIPHDFCNKNAYTCVQLSKSAIGLKNWRIQTPNALYTYMLHK